jgi:hypothetical protein
VSFLASACRNEDARTAQVERERYEDAIELLRSGNEAEAFDLLILLAEAGYAPAQFEVGLMYTDGEGVARNDDEALKWFERAADQGNADGIAALGMSYTLGNDVPKDVDRGMSLLREAADRGSVFGQALLGVAYVTEDPVTALKWFYVARARVSTPSEQKVWGRLESTVSRLEGQLSAAQGAQAQRLASEWKPESGTDRQVVPPTTQVATRYAHTKKAIPASALWRSAVWSNRQTPGITIELASDVGDVVEFMCLPSGNKPVFRLTFGVLPYNLKSAYPSYMINSQIAFPDGISIDTVAHVDVEDGTVSFQLSQQSAKLMRNHLARSNGRFAVNWTSVVPLKSEFDDKERDAQKVFNALKEQGPLTINAPNETHGPIKNLLGVYNQACLGEENDEPALRAAGGWLYDAGVLTPSWVTPSLTYGGGRLRINCIVMGNRASGFVTLVSHPYRYVDNGAKSLTFRFPSGASYRLNTEIDRASWHIQAQLDRASVRTLVGMLRNERGEMRVAWNDKFIRVPLPADRTDLGDFLARCS